MTVTFAVAFAAAAAAVVPLATDPFSLAVALRLFAARQSLLPPSCIHNALGAARLVADAAPDSVPLLTVVLLAVVVGASAVAGEPVSVVSLVGCVRPSTISLALGFSFTPLLLSSLSLFLAFNEHC